MRRMGCLFGALVFLALAAGSFAFWSIVNGLGSPSEGNPVSLLLRGVGLVVLVMVGLSLLFRAIRATTAPIGELMEAAGRVEAGDYSARVKERGPGDVRAMIRSFNSMAAKLQDNAQQRQALLADVTHELRTPLTIIQGNLEGLMDGVYPRDDTHLAPIVEETRMLARLIEDLRTLALAESGSLKLEREPVDLAALAGQVIAAFQAQADAAGIRLEANMPPGLTLVMADPMRIRAVLSNLVANGLRYTPRDGAIHIAGEADAAANRVAISVSDNGSGISPEALPHIFDRFYKSRDSLGTGLGLAIAKQLVNAHGGEISAHSELGRGTTIRFTLKMKDEG